mmetsp:Transcript_24874/g.55239  ORF Transcript_24874/g.55239 Transcript_24874/m.55239 type:complete len:278 (-) Transcript_24874:148-981(-)|eukprot:CAMPEP_0170612718 /NCGR_PEP_ID=MMETSP0224-20130122/23875_1 /TAXON_ID=285029 /ORGANISM="Togula jolla, Strain CCCM 725" /LENGTH=277 /DNA_ID=CAMNT_0010938245 /DNA_START=72 /DNA_END=905 /DNA_ORIENTATION=+
MTAATGCLAAFSYDHLGEIPVTELRTGDVVLFREPKFTSPDNCILQVFFRWDVNHCGLAVDPADFPAGSKVRQLSPMQNDRRYVLHMTTHGLKLWDVDQYLAKMSKRRFDKGTTFARRLLPGMQSEKAFRKQLATHVDEIFTEFQNKRYEGNLLSILRGYFDSCEGDKCFVCPTNCCATSNDLSSLFCSELLAEALQRANVLSRSRHSDEFMPQDFWDSDGVKIEKTNFILGKKLAPATKVRRPTLEEIGACSAKGSSTSLAASGKGSNPSLNGQPS